MYVNGTPVTVSSLDQDAGTVTLAVAPALNDKVTIDYMHSEVSDEQVILAMNIAEELVDDLIRGKNSASNAYTQIIDGDGESNIFYFDHFDVTAVSSVTIDGSAKTLNTDYWVYKHRGNATLMRYIKLLSAPINDNQNISIVYTHGQQTDLGDELSNLFAARSILLGDVKSGRTSGKWVQGDGKDKTKSPASPSRLRILNSEISQIMSVLDRKFRHETA